MFDDRSGQLVELARELDQQGWRLDEHAGALLREADAAQWRSAAAEAMREQARRQAGRLRAAGDSGREAAAAVLRHAAQVREAEDRTRRLLGTG